MKKKDFNDFTDEGMKAAIKDEVENDRVKVGNFVQMVES